MAAAGELDKRLIASIVIGVVGLAMLIAGSVMLGVGISKANSKSSCPPANQCPTVPSCPKIDPSAVFTTSYSPSIQYTPDLSNPNSDAFKQNAAALSQNITALLNAPTNVSSKASILALSTGSTVTINSFTQTSSGQGVNFYASIIFPYNGMSSADVQQQMDTLYPTTADVSPTSTCASLAVPPGQSTSAPVVTCPTNPPPTTTTTTPPPTFPPGVYCNAVGQSVLTVFLIDVAAPIVGTLEDKLATIRGFLDNYDQWIGLHNMNNWGNVQLQFVTYTAYHQGVSNACADDGCWHTQIDALVPGIVNPDYDPEHRLSYGLESVRTVIPTTTTQARNLIIISDGFDITDTDSAFFANQLKASYFQIGAFLASTSPIAQAQFEQVVSNIGLFYPVSDMSYLNNDGVDWGLSQWTCNAPLPPTTPTVPVYTLPPLKTTSTTPTTTTTRPAITTPSGPVPVPNCVVDVLFLVDESQSMIKNGYDQSLGYVKTLAYQLFTTNQKSSFAIVTFNSAVVYKSPSYMNYNDFITAVNAIPHYEGSTDFLVGFNAARDVIANRSRYAVDSIRSVMIFLSDGFDNSGTIQNVQPVSHDLRSTYQTEIIALGLSENTAAQQLTKQAIDYGAQDSYVQSQYIDAPDYNQINSAQMVNATVTSIACKVTPSVCSSDITFVIEVSEDEGPSNIEVEKKVVNGLISHYKNIIGPNAGDVSLVFFSSPDGLNGIEFGRSGILYQLTDDVNYAISTLSSKTFQAGGASDINLAMNLVQSVLNSDNDDNDQLVIFFARGIYKEADNCCDDPTVSAAKVRSIATVQGVAIGSSTNITNLNTFTGSNSLDGTSLLVKNQDGSTNTDASAAAIQTALIPIIDNHFNYVYCPPLPKLAGPCQQYDDVAIIMHANNQTNWDIMKQFVIQEIIPSLSGPLSTSASAGFNINFVIITYFGQTVQALNVLSNPMSTSKLAGLLNATGFVQPTDMTNSLTQAYKQAGQQFIYGRPLATKTLLVLTDTVDEADVSSASIQRTRLPDNSYVYGIRVGSFGGINIPGQDDGTVISDVQQLNPVNPRTAISVSNLAFNGLCRNILLTTPAIPTTPTPKPTPGPIPPVKARNVWPDVTVLVDASQQDASFYETQRVFIRKTFLNQFRVGYKWSRFTVATYSNSTNVVCEFNDIANYWDLEACMGTQISYNNVVNNAVGTRDINQALNYLATQVYAPDKIARSGYKSLKENYLYVLTNGKSLNNFYNSATVLKNAGIRLIGIDISSQGGMEPVDLTNFGPDSYKVTGWQNPTVSDLLSQSIVLQTTTQPKPMLSSLFSDFYFIVDNSLSQFVDLPNVQDFITKFSQQITVSPHRSRMSIVPYADVLLSNLPLTDDPSKVTSFLNQWKVWGPGGANANVGLAISNVLSQVQANSNRLSHVIYLVGADSTTGANTASSLYNTNGVVAYTLAYNSQANYTGLLAADPSLLYKVQGSENLLNWVESSFPVDIRGTNPMNQFFLRLIDIQDTADTLNFPTKEIAADVVILLDETGMTQDDFAHMKQYLVNFTNQFTISHADTQFAFQAFSGQIIPEAGWHFFDSSNNDFVTSKINNLTLEQTAADTPADLSGAVYQSILYFLQPQFGWREDVATFTIILSNAQTFAYSQNVTFVQQQLKQKSEVFAISMDNTWSQTVFDFTNTGFYLLTNGPQSMSTDTGVGSNLTQNINSVYKNIEYPPLPALSDVTAHYIFLIDNTNATQYEIQIRTFLRKFLANVGSPDLFGGSRMSVLNYNSMGVVASSSWTLSTYPNSQLLNKAITNMKISNDTNPPDLVAAIGYFEAIPDLFGMDRYHPVFVTGLFNSATIDSPLSQSVMSSVNTKYFTYGIQYNANNVPFDYLQTFLGADYGVDFVYTEDLSTFGIEETNQFFDYVTYIRSEALAWQQTFLSN